MEEVSEKEKEEIHSVKEKSGERLQVLFWLLCVIFLILRKEEEIIDLKVVEELPEDIKSEVMEQYNIQNERKKKGKKRKVFCEGNGFFFNSNCCFFSLSESWSISHFFFSRSN